MTMMLNVNEKYISKVEHFIASLPTGAVKITNSLNEEISKRVNEYRSGKMETTPLMEGIDEIRENLVSQLG